MSALERRSYVPLVVVAIALASLLGAALSTAQETGPPESIDLSLERTCAPDTFRPDEYVAVECVTRLANQGQTTLTDISLSIGGYSGILPSYFFMWSERNGEFLPISTGALTFEGADLEPGETNVSSTVVLLRMEEGTFESELRASVGGQVIASAPIRFVATPGAAEPPTALLVTTEPVGEVSEEPQPTATYETTITNQGSGEVTELTLTERYQEAATIASAQPAPASQNSAVQLASWDLASFAMDSLAPGESLVLRTIYGPSVGSDCGWVSTGLVVEATVGDQEQRYGARPSEGVSVGECAVGGIGGGLPATLAYGGEGPVSSRDGASWLAAALAGAGLVLVGAGLAARRRARV